MSYEVGVVHVQRTELGDKTVVGIDYKQACLILAATTTRTGLVRSVNGAIDLPPAEKIKLDSIGFARLLSKTASQTCVDEVRSVVADPDEWSWSTVSIQAEDHAGVSCLGILHEVRDDDGTIIQPGQAIVVTL